MNLLFVHGWGFDASIWQSVADRLDQWACAFVERGYFGEAHIPEMSEPFVLVAHSFGAMWALRNVSPNCRGLVAVNGFDCFAARPDFTGVPSRLLDRMIAQFDQEPKAVVGEFRRRCGASAPCGEPDVARLRDDLLAMRDVDCRAETARVGWPILSLQGTDDPILPPAMREAVFASASQAERKTFEGGHLLPLTVPDFCAAQITTFAEASV